MPRCPYCHTESAPDYQYSDRRMTVCASCDAWFVWPAPTPEALFAHYAGNTAGMPGDLREFRTDTRQTEWYEHLARRIARIAPKGATRLADIGAGGLELTTSLARVFETAHVAAWDLFADGIDQALPADVSSRISLHTLDLNRVAANEVPPGSYDVVACVAVIEHVLDPLALLRLLASMTAPGGMAYVVGPAVDSMARRIMRQRWPYYVPDEHLTLPSAKSLQRAVKLAGGGEFQVRKTSVYYSSRYLFRFLHFPQAVASAFDVLLPIPAGAFEMIWHPGVSSRA